MKLPSLKLKDKFVKEKFSLGLDIGTSFIKTVKLKFSKDVIELCGLTIELAPQLDLEPALKKVAHTQDTKNVNISVCGPATVIRYVNFPKMNAEEMKQALKFEAEKYIPFATSDVNLDSYILKHDLPDNKMLLLLAAVKKEAINQRLKLVENAGFNVHAIDIDSIAIINAFEHNYGHEENLKDKAIALLNIGASLTSLNILENNTPRLSRDIHIAGNSIAQKLADNTDSDLKAAEQLIVNAAAENLEKIASATEAITANLAKEIRASFDYYESQSSLAVSKIFLSGGASIIPGIKEILANLVGMEVEYWDPFKKINIAASISQEKLKPIASQLAVAVGLALHP